MLEPVSLVRKGERVEDGQPVVPCKPNPFRIRCRELLEREELRGGWRGRSQPLGKYGMSSRCVRVVGFTRK
jgi:hypothetical protein